MPCWPPPLQAVTNTALNSEKENPIADLFLYIQRPKGQKRIPANAGVCCFLMTEKPAWAGFVTFVFMPGRVRAESCLAFFAVIASIPSPEPPDAR